MAKSSLEVSLKRLFSQLFFVLIFLLLASYFVAMLLGPLVFFSTADGLAASRRVIQRLPIVIFGVDTGINVNISVGLFFLSLWFVFLVCFIIASVVREDFFVSLEKFNKGSVVAAFRNYLLFMPLVASFSFVSALVIELFLEGVGVPVDAPPVSGDGSSEFRAFMRFLSISYAPVIEEIGFRIIPIGVFLVFYLSVLRKQAMMRQVNRCSWKALVVAPFFPDKAKRDCGLKTVDEFGVRGGISYAEWVMIVIAAFVFGFAHFPLSYWGPGKFVSATVIGLVLGVVYLAYGFVAPVLLHWFFNYYFNVFYLAYNYYSQLPFLIFAVEYVNILLGLLAWFAIFYVVVRRLRRKRESEAVNVV